MKNLVTKLEEAQKLGMSLRPKVGGFPILAEALRCAGIRLNQWSLPSCQSVYIMSEGNLVQQGTPLITGTHEIPSFNKVDLISAIRKDQEGKSTFPEFLKEAWLAGVIGYNVDFEKREVCYYGVNDERYVESYQAIELPS